MLGRGQVLEPKSQWVNLGFCWEQQKQKKKKRNILGFHLQLTSEWYPFLMFLLKKKKHKNILSLFKSEELENSFRIYNLYKTI